MQKLLNELKERGFIKDITDEKLLVELLEKKSKVYIGFDPTASSLHLGHLLPINLLKHFHSHGIHVIPVLGGGTGMIGDPSGKKSERVLLTNEQVIQYSADIRKQLINIFKNKDVTVYNNYEWLSKISTIELLRDYGKHFTINYMLDKDAVSKRMENGISFTEFTYMILQAIDFYTLATRDNCLIQFGGSDQWGNITCGVELLRKKEGIEAAGGTIHLLVTSTGAKFGKSENNAIYLDKNLSSPYSVYQYFLNSTDDDCEKYLKLFTFYSLEEINNIVKKHNEDKGARYAQKSLAYAVVKDLHGSEYAEQSKRISEVLFTGKFQILSDEELLLALNDVPKIKITGTTPLIDLLVSLEAATSKSEARKLIQSKGISIDSEVVSDINILVSPRSRPFVVKKGKKNYYLILN